MARYGQAFTIQVCSCTMVPDWYTYSTSDGLSSNYLKDMLFDSRGRYWVLADNGINMSANFTNIDEPGFNSFGEDFSVSESLFRIF